MSQNGNMLPLRAFTRRHYNVLEAEEGNLRGLGVVGASPGTPPKWLQYGLVLYAYFVLMAYYTVCNVSKVRMKHP